MDEISKDEIGLFKALGEKEIRYRWHIIHRPELAQYCLYMFRYERLQEKHPYKKWALNANGQWEPIAEGAEAPVTLAMPDILVSHLADTGVANFFDGKRVEQALIDFCTRIMTGVIRDPRPAPQEQERGKGK